MKSVIIIYGPPGSGKGTQARKIAKEFDLESFDTGQIIEDIIYDKANQGDPIIQREKKNFEEGLLCTPEWVTELVKDGIEKYHQQKNGLIFSGSPRTLYEVKIVMPLLEKLYSRNNLFIIRLLIKPETSIFRNSNRRVCEKCGQPIVFTPENEKLEICPVCGGKLATRTLDNKEDIKVRLKEYEERTKPIFKFLDNEGYKLINIDGEPPVEEVAKSILEKLSIK